MKHADSEVEGADSPSLMKNVYQPPPWRKHRDFSACYARVGREQETAKA